MSMRVAMNRLSPEQYLQDEQDGEIKHEYANGEVFAMAGESEAHNLISGSLFAALHAHLRRSDCRVFMSDMKVRVQTLKDTHFYYPDLLVTCSAEDKEHYFKTQPKLIIEVLSEFIECERYDRAEKFYAYQHLASLEEYVLIAQDEPRIEIYRRATDWYLEIYGAGESLHLQSVDLALAVDEVFEQVQFVGINPAADMGT